MARQEETDEIVGVDPEVQMTEPNELHHGNSDSRNDQVESTYFQEELAPETINWQLKISGCSDGIRAFRNDGGFKGLPTGDLSDRIKFRSELVEELRSDRELTGSEAEDIVDHAVHLGLLGTSPNGAFVYIPDKEVRVDGLW